MQDSLLVLSVFTACSVEAVEALTIVLAVGMTRGWGSSSYGAIAAGCALAVVVGVTGPALTRLPPGALHLAVGRPPKRASPLAAGEARSTTGTRSRLPSTEFCSRGWRLQSSSSRSARTSTIFRWPL